MPPPPYGFPDVIAVADKRYLIVAIARLTRHRQSCLRVPRPTHCCRRPLLLLTDGKRKTVPKTCCPRSFAFEISLKISSENENRLFRPHRTRNNRTRALGSQRDVIVFASLTVTTNSVPENFSTLAYRKFLSHSRVPVAFKGAWGVGHFFFFYNEARHFIVEIRTNILRRRRLLVSNLGTRTKKHPLRTTRTSGFIIGRV